jgi:hypothetical protein
MAQSGELPQDVGPFAEVFTAAADLNRAQALLAWTRGCEVYAHYFEALAKAHTAEGVYAANAQLVSEMAEVFGPRAAPALEPGAQADRRGS